MDRVTDKYVFFWGDTTFSNWGNADFIYKDHKFGNTEQAFMWEKAVFFKDEKIAEEILANTNPSYCKKLGRQIKRFDAEQWLIDSFIFMVAVNYCKYSQNSDLKEILLSTGDKTIVEASPYDRIWGIGIHWNDDACLDEANWLGKNLLGKALMHVRMELQNENKDNEKNN
jgi:ribA/ribD-fused uncharacterized protein